MTKTTKLTLKKVTVTTLPGLSRSKIDRFSIKEKTKKQRKATIKPQM